MSSIGSPDAPARDRVAAGAGIVGGVLGVVAGLVELSVGSSIRSWIGDKEDPTRLGVVTIVLASIALAAALDLRRAPAPGRARRATIVAGLLVPAGVCATTVGRLWYVPGTLLLVAACAAALGLRGEVRAAFRDLERDAAGILTLLLAAVYVGLGLTALQTVGWVAIVGAGVVVGFLVVRPRWSVPVVVATLIVAVAPFAVLTWWSVVTPLAAVLIVALGTLAVAAWREPGLASPSRAHARPRGDDGRLRSGR